jgi:hypothetical protein
MASPTSFTYSLRVFSFLLHLFQLLFTPFSIISDNYFSFISHLFHFIRSSFSVASDTSINYFSHLSIISIISLNCFSYLIQFLLHFSLLLIEPLLIVSHTFFSCSYHPLICFLHLFHLILISLLVFSCIPFCCFVSFSHLTLVSLSVASHSSLLLLIPLPLASRISSNCFLHLF